MYQLHVKKCSWFLLNVLVLRWNYFIISARRNPLTVNTICFLKNVNLYFLPILFIKLKSLILLLFSVLNFYFFKLNSTHTLHIVERWRDNLADQFLNLSQGTEKEPVCPLGMMSPDVSFTNTTPKIHCFLPFTPKRKEFYIHMVSKSTHFYVFVTPSNFCHSLEITVAQLLFPERKILYLRSPKDKGHKSKIMFGF